MPKDQQLSRQRSNNSIYNNIPNNNTHSRYHHNSIGTLNKLPNSLPNLVLNHYLILKRPSRLGHILLLHNLPRHSLKLKLIINNALTLPRLFSHHHHQRRQLPTLLGLSTLRRHNILNKSKESKRLHTHSMLRLNNLRKLNLSPMLSLSLCHNSISRSHGQIQQNQAWHRLSMLVS